MDRREKCSFLCHWVTICPEFQTTADLSFLQMSHVPPGARAMKVTFCSLRSQRDRDSFPRHTPHMFRALHRNERSATPLELEYTSAAFVPRTQESRPTSLLSSSQHKLSDSRPPYPLSPSPALPHTTRHDEHPPSQRAVARPVQRVRTLADNHRQLANFHSPGSSTLACYSHPAHLAPRALHACVSTPVTSSLLQAVLPPCVLGQRQVVQPAARRRCTLVPAPGALASLAQTHHTVRRLPGLRRILPRFFRDVPGDVARQAGGA